ncbi:hypothetical protein QE435_001076 [Rhizobium sp. SORGH_AS 787]|nr:hypothetical protein [Rhizobium sp. SORGH_AS_0787]
MIHGMSITDQKLADNVEVEHRLKIVVDVYAFFVDFLGLEIDTA